MRKWDVVKAIIKDYADDLPLTLYWKEPMKFRFEGFRKNKIVVECYSEFSHVAWNVELTPTEFIDNCYVAEDYMKEVK